MNIKIFQNGALWDMPLRTGTSLALHVLQQNENMVRPSKHEKIMFFCVNLPRDC